MAKLNFLILRGFLLALVLVLVPAQPVLAAADQIEIILDASGSMKEGLDGREKIAIARESLKEVLNKIPAESHIGFRAFGHNLGHKDPNTCTDTELLFPIGKVDRQKLDETIQKINVRGETPLAYSLEKAGDDFAADVKKTVVLLSDGKETCGGDPVAVLKKLKDRGIELVVHTIGFAVDDEAAKQLKAIADASSGSYFEAKDASQLTVSIEKAVAVAPPPPPKKEKPKSSAVNLLSKDQGGQIVTASHDKFAHLIDGADKEIYWFYPGQEAVFAFKDEGVATIEKIAVPIFETNNDNIGSFEIHVSTDSPLEGFSKAGTFTPKNMKMFKSVFQEFKIEPPVKAKYIKLVLGTSASGGKASKLYEIQAFGTLGGEVEAKPAPKPAPTSTAKAVNLLSPEEGGQIITASHDKFARLIDGKDDEIYWFYPGQEAVFAFKDEKAATISKLALPIFETNNDNIGSFDVFASPDSAMEGFTKVGTYTPKNMKMFQSVYQEFDVNPPVKAKYIKIVLGKGAGGGKASKLYELKVLGELK